MSHIPSAYAALLDRTPDPSFSYDVSLRVELDLEVFSLSSSKNIFAHLTPICAFSGLNHWPPNYVSSVTSRKNNKEKKCASLALSVHGQNNESS